MRSYSVFAKYYDELTANIDYKKRGEYFNSIIKKFNRTDNNILLDLGCGTGSLSEVMSELGYDVIGIDNSMEMLGIAMEKNFEKNLPIQYLCQDMREIDMFGTIGITICALDSINHLESPEDVRKVFEKVSLFAEPQGLFIFDINTPYKHRNILADNTFTYETDNVYCVWENSLNRNTDEVSIHLEFFECDEDDKNIYYRSSESFREKAYSLESIEKMLEESGLEVIAEYDDDSFNPPYEESQRIVVVARAVKIIHN